MFWIGIIIAFLSGITSLTIARNSIQQRYSRLKELQLDIISLVLLLIGLGLSAFDHLESDRTVKQLERQQKVIRDMKAMLSIVATKEPNVAEAVVMYWPLHKSLSLTTQDKKEVIHLVSELA